MDVEAIDQMKLNWSPDTTIALNFAIAFIMFGVSLDLSKDSFISLVKNPKSTITGVVSQFILLPFFTFLLVWLLEPQPGLALGMILVAACPGGNLSNFFTSLSKGNVALSISLTVMASFLAVILTPFNFEFYGSLLHNTAPMLKLVNISFWEMVRLVFFTIALPLLMGYLFKLKWPATASRVEKPVRYISFFILIAIIAIAFANNYRLFLRYYHYILTLVLLHNALALGTGYFLADL